MDFCLSSAAPCLTSSGALSVSLSLSDGVGAGAGREGSGWWRHSLSRELQTWVLTHLSGGIHPGLRHGHSKTHKIRVQNVWRFHNMGKLAHFPLTNIHSSHMF